MPVKPEAQRCVSGFSKESRCQAGYPGSLRFSSLRYAKPAADRRSAETDCMTTKRGPVYNPGVPDATRGAPELRFCVKVNDAEIHTVVRSVCRVGGAGSFLRIF